MSKKNAVAEKKDTKSGVICLNRKASFNYLLLDKFEAGMVLTGNEIKSMKAGGVSITEAYVRVVGTEAWLIGAHVKEYEFSHDSSYEPTRSRKLLLNKAEMNKLRGQVERKGLTIVPTRIYLKNGRAKLEIALAKSKNAPDKKKDIISKEKDLEARRAMKNKKNA